MESIRASLSKQLYFARGLLSGFVLRQLKFVQVKWLVGGCCAQAWLSLNDPPLNLPKKGKYHPSRAAEYRFPVDASHDGSEFGIQSEYEFVWLRSGIMGSILKEPSCRISP
ncbi:MAG: hypothetical protein U0X71_08585 [Sphingobacteriaceae bacterium]